MRNYQIIYNLGTLQVSIKTFIGTEEIVSVKATEPTENEGKQYSLGKGKWWASYLCVCCGVAVGGS